MRLAVLLQARMDSSRLPGKVMMELEGKSLLSHVIERVLKVVPDIFIITTPESTEIIEYAKTNNICYSLDHVPRDVLDSYYQCANSYGIEHIIRITADNPLIRPETISKVISFYFHGDYDWAANCRLKTTFPVGDDVEIFSFKVLEKAFNNTSDKYDREHVTPYIYNHPELFKLGVLENDSDQSNLRWTVDTMEDLENVRKLVGDC